MSVTLRASPILYVHEGLYVQSPRGGKARGESQNEHKKRSRLALESSYQPGSMAVDVMLFKAQIKETKLVCHTPWRYYHT